MEEPTYVKGFHDESLVQKMTYSQLGKTGLRVSKLSLGGGPIGGIYNFIEEEEAVSVIQAAIKAGINYIDTAPWYGQGRSETIIGKALKKVPRKAYYIGTKVGRYEINVNEMFDFSAERVRRSVDQSLKLLGLDYVDIIQIHDLEFAENFGEGMKQILNETLPAVQDIVREGKARFIGITGYPLLTLREAVEKTNIKIDTVLSYSRYTLIDHELSKYISFFEEREIGVINGGLVALGLLTPHGGQSWHPVGEEIKRACLEAKRYCQERGVNIADLAIKHGMGLEGVSTNLLGVDKYTILEQNLKLATEPTTEEELKLIEEIRKRFFLPLSLRNWENNEIELLMKQKLKQNI